MFDFASTLLAVTALINLGLAVLTLRQNPSSPIHRSFAFFVLFIALWAVVILGFREVGSDLFAIYLLKLAYVSALLLGASFYYFSLVFPDGIRPGKVHFGVLQVSTGFLCLALLLPSFLTGDIVQHPWGREVILDLWAYLLYVAVFSSLFLGGLVRIWRKYLSATGLVRAQLFSLGASVTVSGLIGIYYNLLLPSPFFQDFRYVWTGPLFTSAFAIVIIYSIFRYKLFNVKAILAELLVFFLWIVIIVRIFLSTATSELIADLVLFGVSVPIGVLLLRSIRLEVRAKESLALANARLKELDRRKSEFISIASHQLRTPITMIHGYASMLEEGTFGLLPEQARRPVAQIAGGAKGLVSVIDDYLNVSRIELGEMVYKFEVVDLKPLVEEVVETFKPSALKAGLELSFEMDKAAAYHANVDIGKITQVISNLLDNAIKYTPTGWVTVRLSQESSGKTVRLAIRDTGIGIDPAMLTRLFQKFSRADDAKETNTTGTGLGLYVAAQLVKAHEGRLWAESPGRGKGSTFFLELPSANAVMKRNNEGTQLTPETDRATPARHAIPAESERSPLQFDMEQ